MIELREYQRKAIDALYGHWQEGGGNALIDLATGTGKSLVGAQLFKELLDGWPGFRIASVTHRKELIIQNCQELLKLWPSAPVGIYSAGVGRKDRGAQILFGGIQSIYDKDLCAFDLVLIDEAHLTPRSADSMYGRFLADCRRRVPDMRVVGLTATPYRTGSGRLDRGPDALFEKIVFSYGIADGVADGYLAPLVSKKTNTELNVDGVRIQAGDFLASDIEARTFESDYIARTAAEIVERGMVRSGWLVFCAGCAHGEAMRLELARLGVKVATIFGETAQGERDRLIKSFKNKEIKCLISCGVLTTGFNAPHVDLIALCRATLSTGLYVQMLGRGSRLADDKLNCLILDFGGNIRRHGPVDEIKIRDKDPVLKIKKDDIRAKVCPNCEGLISLRYRVCPDCDYEFVDRNEQKHEEKPDIERPVMASIIPLEWKKIDDMRVFLHKKEGKTPSMCVSYLSGLHSYKEWICFEHTGFPRTKAIQWWRAMGGDLPIPDTVVDAISREEKELKMPSEILIKDGKFPEIINRKFKENEMAEELELAMF